MVQKKVSASRGDALLNRRELHFIEEFESRPIDEKDNLSFEDLEALPQILRKKAAMQKIQEEEQEEFERYKESIGYGNAISKKRKAEEAEIEKVRDGDGRLDHDGDGEFPSKVPKVDLGADAFGIRRRQKLYWAKMQAKRVDMSRLRDVDTSKLQGRQHVYDTDLLTAKLKEITQEDLPWGERMDLTTDTDVIQALPHEEVTQRELGFYEAALKAANQGLAKCEEMHVMHQRPDDFYAEMVKSDRHMHRVRFQLLLDKRRVELAEERRKQREYKKFGKVILAEKAKEKARNFAKTAVSIDKWRKNKKQGGTDIDDQFDIGFDKDDQTLKKETKKQRKEEELAAKKTAEREELKERKARAEGGIFGRDNKMKKKVTKKQAAKDAQYGFGGRKKGMKRNTAESVNSFLDADSIQHNRNAQKNNSRMKTPKKTKKPVRHKKRR